MCLADLCKPATVVALSNGKAEARFANGDVLTNCEVRPDGVVACKAGDKLWEGKSLKR
jgi:hypothetical protein